MNKVNKLISLALLATGIFLPQTAISQFPQKMSYQAVIRDNLDQLVKSHKVGIKITILQGTPTGIVVYSETQMPATNVNGLVSIIIGSGNVESGNFETIDWENGTYFLKTEADPAGGTSYSITGTSQLLSVPYALHAKTAETFQETDPVFTSWDKSYSDLENKPSALSDFTMNANSKNITDLADPLNAQDIATKAYVDALLPRIEAMENLEPILLENGFTDARDGNHYKAVKIGNQVWMAENLKYLPGVVGPATGSQSIPCYYVYGYDGTNVTDAKATSNYSVYGVLYNWPAAMAGSASSTTNPSGVQGVCPTGWHLPSDAEWTELIDTLGGASEAGGKLKETGTIHWKSPNTGATNEYGFTGLPGGRLEDWTFSYNGDYGYWWSTSESETSIDSAWYRYLLYNFSAVGRLESFFSWGWAFSVRCVRD